MRAFVFLDASGQPERVAYSHRQPAGTFGEGPFIEADLPAGVALRRLRVSDDGQSIEVLPDEGRASCTAKLRPDAATRDGARALRAQAFRRRSDPLLGKLLRGEITQEAFNEIAAQIRAEFPYPQEVKK